MNPRRWDEVQAVFDELVALDATSRAGRLATLATTDPELRAAVESLLAADAEAEARLAPLEAALLPQAAPAPDPLDLAGRTVSHFRVGEPLGAGGMGAVYRAEDTRLGRAVALKFLLPHLGLDANAKARFLREAHSAASLDHPNLCSIHEVGESDEGRLFLAMALYPGETLKARLARDGPLPIAEALHIARQVAAGLACADAAGIVHRDLKPANVMLLPDGTVKILDFGLAKARDQSLTESGAVLGTVLYMAPEQVSGDTVDPRADLWALGVVLYETLTGRTPFEGDQHIAIAHAILNDDPVPPSTHRADVSVTLEEVVLRLLEKNPDNRYASATELLANLARVGKAAARMDRLFWHARRARRVLATRRARIMMASTAIVLLSASIYAAIARKNANSAAIAARTAIAVLPFRDLSADSSHAYFVSGLHDEILRQLYKIPALKVIGRNSVMGYSGRQPPPLKQIARELGVGSIVDASVQVVTNRVRVSVQLVDAATETPLWLETYERTVEDAFSLQSDIAQQIVATVGVVLGGAERRGLTSVPTEKTRAYLLYLQGREIERRPDGRSHENLEAAARLYEQAIALDSSFALARATLAGTYLWMYIARYDMTAARLVRARTEAEIALRLAPDLPQAHQAMGGVLNVGPNTNPQAALKEWQLALRGAPNDARLWGHVAAVHRQTGNWEEYERTFRKVVELEPRNATFLYDYGGDTHLRMGRFADAIHWYERAAGITGDTVLLTLQKAWIYSIWKGDMEPIRAWMLGEGGQIARKNGWIYPQINFWLIERQPDSLLRVLKEARQSVFQSAFQFEPVALWSAAAHELRGDQAAARAAYDTALVIADSGIREYPDDFAPHGSRGLALAGLGRRQEALDEVRKVRENFLYKDVWVREQMVAGIAYIYAKLGDVDGTVDNLEQILKERYAGLTIHQLRLQPDWDRVRAHPRFQALLTKYANHPNVRS